MITELINLRISPMPRSANINGSRKYRLPKADEPLCKQRYRTTVYFYDRFLNADAQERGQHRKDSSRRHCAGVWAGRFLP